MLAQQRPLPTPGEYLRTEENSAIRHEYVGGCIHTMAGNSLRHNRIAGNLAAKLLGHLRGKPCQVSIADVKLHVAKADAYYYPDVMVNCGGDLADATQAVSDATLVVEVLSPSTELTDRREKFNAYRRLPSLQEYVLIAQEYRQIEVLRRQGDVGWLCLTYEVSGPFELASVGLECALEDVYEGTDTPEQLPKTGQALT